MPKEMANMSERVQYTVHFVGLTDADAGRATESLRRALQEVDPTIQARQVRTNAEALDFGTALAVFLTAPAAVELARGISNWLTRTPSSKVTVIGPDGTTIVENIGARDAARLAETLPKHGRR
jgi:hypothetical protein